MKTKNMIKKLKLGFGYFMIFYFIAVIIDNTIQLFFIWLPKLSFPNFSFFIRLVIAILFFYLGNNLLKEQKKKITLKLIIISVTITFALIFLVMLMSII